MINRVPVSICITPEQNRRLDLLAAQMRLSKSATLGKLVDDEAARRGLNVEDGK